MNARSGNAALAADFGDARAWRVRLGNDGALLFLSEMAPRLAAGKRHGCIEWIRIVHDLAFFLDFFILWIEQKTPPGVAPKALRLQFLRNRRFPVFPDAIF